MKSKSRRMEYKVREVVGKPLGRVQYFLNKTFVQLLEERRIKSVHGLVCWEQFFVVYGWENPQSLMILPRGDLFFSSASLFNIFSQSSFFWKPIFYWHWHTSKLIFPWKSSSLVPWLMSLCFFVTVMSLVNQQSVKNRPPPRSGKKNKQTGGGAVIPCMWVLKVTKEFADRVEGIVRSHLPDVVGLETMEVQVSN